MSETAGGRFLYDIERAAFEADGRLLLAPVSLRLEPGKMIGLIGHNGSGKSTLLKLMANQQTVSQGAIRLRGIDLRRWRPTEFARCVAYLPQQPPAAGAMTVRELVALGRYPWHGALGRLRAHDRERVAQALDLTALTGHANSLVEYLSGGERQRAWLAMLVAQQASCLLLDEPTSALDIAHQIDVLTLLRGLCATRSMTVVIALHDINLAARFCDDLIALRAGALLARGAPADIMTGPMLESIYGIPMDILTHPNHGWPVCVAR